MKINPQDYIGKAIFITATNTNVGKTFASEVFLKYFAKNGLKVGYFKPIETGVIDNSPLDGLKMFELVKKLNPNFLKLTINDIVPYQFTLPASPYVAKGNTFLDIDFLIEKKEYLQTFCDVLIIEGAGGQRAGRCPGTGAGADAAAHRGDGAGTAQLRFRVELLARLAGRLAVLGGQALLSA